MNDHLEHLRDIAVPEPSKDARSVALQAGVAAFDAMGAEKISTTGQDAEKPRRLTGRADATPWRRFMDTFRIPAPVAASLLILPAAALLAYQMFEYHPQRNPAPKTATTEERDGAELAAVSRQDGPVRLPAPPPEQVRNERAADAHQPPPPSPVGKAAVGESAKAVSPPAAGAPAAYEPARIALGVLPQAPVDAIARPQERSRDSFAAYDPNPVKSVKAEPVSTFSVDVDTASYAFVRRLLNAGTLPPPEAVRVEEMINYFPYDYPVPQDAKVPFSTNVAVYPTPWNADTKLLHIGLKAYDVVPAARPASNMVFLIDVSGSMDSPDKLPLLKTAFRMLLDQLGESDTVSIVTYAGNAGTVLEPTPASEKGKILDAIDRLEPGGGTAGAAGIEEAYRLAETARREGGVNRVILATDGDFNVGASDPESLKRLVEARRKSGVFLSVLGFGQGNYQDDLMQTLAQNGNGVAAYIDTLNEARKVLVEEAGAALFTVAKDVKVQVEFNPATVSEYRLIGYETRALLNQDFNNDRVDAGDIGSGHAVTALYEITPAGSPAQLVDDLRYRTSVSDQPTPVTGSDELAFLKLRYKLPGEDSSTRITVPVTIAMESASIAELPDTYRFAASVAAFGQKLRDDPAVDGFGYDRIVELANGARDADPFGYRGEFVNLVRLAETLDRN